MRITQRLMTLNRWLWLALSIVLGPIVGYLQTGSGDTFAWHEAPTISQLEFEQLIRQTGDDSQQSVRNIVIYPDGNTYTVYLERREHLKEQDDAAGARDPKSAKFYRYRFTAPRPYHPATLFPRDRGPNYTVLDFLNDAGRRKPLASYRYAWWGSPAMAMLLWTAMSVLLIGVIWPMLLQLVRGGEPAAILEPAKPIAAPQRQEVELTDVHLPAVESPVLAATPETPQQEKATEPLRALSTETVMAPAAQEAEDKQYAGDFYPVARPASKKSKSAKSS